MIAYFLPFFKSFYYFASFAFDKYYLPLVNASKVALNYFRVHITEMIALEVQKNLIFFLHFGRQINGGGGYSSSPPPSGYAILD